MCHVHNTCLGNFLSCTASPPRGLVLDYCPCNWFNQHRTYHLLPLMLHAKPLVLVLKILLVTVREILEMLRTRKLPLIQDHILDCSSILINLVSLESILDGASFQFQDPMVMAN